MLKRAASPLHNPVLPTKIYGIWNGKFRVGEVTADSTSQALRDAKLKYGRAAQAAIFEKFTKPGANLAELDWSPGGNKR